MMNTSDIPIMILAGGRGTRLMEQTRDVPKPMVTIGGKPILLHLMSYYAKFGFRKFIVDPKPGNLKSFAITHPTPLGGIVLEYSNNRFQLTVPEGAEAVHANTSFASGRHDFRLN